MMKVKFVTLGCKVNQYETQALKENFAKAGFEITGGVADLYIINTCTVTRQADIKSKKAVLKAKRENPSGLIAVCGCLPQLNREDLLPLGVDFIVPQDKKPYLLDFILKKQVKEYKDVWSLKITNFFNQRAFVKIQDGCDNFCSFCKIPYVRGRSKSRPKEEILQEIDRLSARYREVVICGVNIGAYGKDFLRGEKQQVSNRESLASLVKEILKNKNLGRLRLSSLEPRYISDELLELFGRDKICPHLHLPFQSGDDKILSAMNKKERISLYKTLVKRARKINPMIAISCDIMIGCPYEDEKSFQSTVEFLQEVRPMRMHIFTFSPRQKTAWENLRPQEASVTKRRYKILKEMGERFSLEYKERFLGKTLSMICEEKKDGYLCGYTENYLRVFLKDKVPLGEMVKVKIEKIVDDKLFAVRSKTL